MDVLLAGEASDVATSGWLTVVPVATLISVLVTLAIRFADRSRPVLVLESQATERSREWIEWAEEEGLIQGTVAIINVGDGPAYEVETFGHLCDASIPLAKVGAPHTTRWGWRAPVLKASEHVLIEYMVKEPNFDAAKLIIRWTPSPGRPWTALFRRKRVVALSAIDSVMPFPVGVVGPVALPKRFLRWRRLEYRTERGRAVLAKAQKDQPKEG